MHIIAYFLAEKNKGQATVRDNTVFLKGEHKFYFLALTKIYSKSFIFKYFI